MSMPEPAGAVRRLDRKLDAITAGRYTPGDFVLADAKDADMAFGLTSAGPAGAAGGRSGRYRTRGDFLDDMRALVAQGELDIMLTSASNGERLAQDGSLGDMTLAVRGNDSTDVWNSRGGRYPALPSRPFRTADLTTVRPFCDLVLYSMTFNNELDYDLATLEAYGAFRREAAALGIRHFLEVFNPNARRPGGRSGRRVRQRLDHPRPGRGHRCAAAAVPEGGLQRPGRAGRTGRVRPVAGGRHPGRVVRHHPGHLRAAAPSREARRPGRPVRPQDPACGVAAGPGRPDAAGAAGRAETQPMPSAPTTMPWPRPRSPRTARSRPTWR